MGESVKLAVFSLQSAVGSRITTHCLLSTIYLPTSCFDCLLLTAKNCLLPYSSTSFKVPVPSPIIDQSLISSSRMAIIPGFRPR